MTKRDHNCKTIILTCIDFRTGNLREKLKEQEICDKCDVISIAGGAKDLIHGHEEVRKYILYNIGVAVRLHGADHLVTIAHEDCGAYGGDAALGDKKKQVDHHKQELNVAGEIIRKHFPQIAIDNYFAELDAVDRIGSLMPLKD